MTDAQFDTFLDALWNIRPDGNNREAISAAVLAMVENGMTLEWALATQQRFDQRHPH